MLKNNLTELQTNTCIDQASKIVDIKHELGLIQKLINTVSLVSVLDRREAAGAIYSILIGEKALDNVSRTLDVVLNNLEDIATTLSDIDGSEDE